MDFDEIWEEIRGLPKVNGISETLQPRIRGGKEVEEERCVRVYVEEKIPEKLLLDEHVIPKEVQGIPTDVVEIGKVEAPPKGLEKEPSKKKKTDRIRPVMYGISIGNWKITAGTNGWAYEDNRGNVLHGTNAHVGTPDSSMTVGEVKADEVRWIQPGKYDDGTLGDVVARYKWHKRIVPQWKDSECPLSSPCAKIFNAISETFGRRTRLRPIVEEKNHIDFSVGEPTEDYEVELYSFDSSDMVFIGHGFAGSDKVSIGCKVDPYILREGYNPLELETKKPGVGDKVHKDGRTTCHKMSEVVDDSARVGPVSYGNFFATLYDVYLVRPPILQGGDSGTGFFVEV